MSIDTAKYSKSIFTQKEIFQQPELWTQVHEKLSHSKDAIKDFLSPLIAEPHQRIILTGAGSSAFIGETAVQQVSKLTGKIVQAISTTDLVTHAEDFAIENTPTFMVSFARSGNSPESIEAVRLMNLYQKNISHLFITCNENGKLAQIALPESIPCYKLILPDSTNDKGLAMTGSFTSMLLACFLIFDIKNLQNLNHNVHRASETAIALLNQADKIKSFALLPFKRAIFLGSGPLLGMARECHLKLQELTDGKVICKFDSFLGFRHGPRVVANKDAVIIYLFSADEHVRKYEFDLVMQIASDTPEIPILYYGATFDVMLHHCTHLGTSYRDSSGCNLLPYAIIGQMLGYYKSLDLGLDPDNPSVSGAISRVVQGVNLYQR